MMSVTQMMPATRMMSVTQMIFAAHLIGYWGGVLLHRHRGSWRGGTLRRGAAPPQDLEGKHVVSTVIANQMVSVLAAPVLEYLVGRTETWASPNQMAMLTYTAGGFLLFTCAYDLVFGSLHLLTHRAQRWGLRIHAKHHEMVVPIGAGAVYCHWAEHLFVNVGAFLVVCAILPVPSATLILFALIGSYNTIVAHLPQQSEHARHHAQGRGNFGNWPFLFDRICRTHAGP